MFKISLSFFLLALVSGCAHAGIDDDLVLHTEADDFFLGSVSKSADGHGQRIALRVVTRISFCRDASFKINFDQSKNAAIDFDSKKWLYKFPGSEGRECGDEKDGGYALEFSASDGSDLMEVDLALENIFKFASAKSVASDVVIFDDVQILECVFKQGELRFSEIYNDFGTKLDDDGIEMKQRMPSVVFHVVSSEENSRCRDAYVLAFFPEKSKKIYFFVTSMAALPL
jgi:hypothetical protein